MGLNGLVVAVALVQLHSEPLADRTHRATAALTKAAADEADIALLPADFVTDAPLGESWGALARKLQMAIAVPYVAGDNSSIALYSMNGSLALSHSAPRGSAEAPVAGARPMTVQLPTKHGSVAVGAMLGTDYMFYQPARVLMVQGAELVLNPVAVKGLHAATIAGGRSPTDATHSADSKFLSALVQDNLMHYSNANYATIGAEPAGGSGGGRGSLSFADATEQTVLLKVNVSEIRNDRLVAGVWSGGMDFLSRKPYQYQPLCYAEARAAHVASNAGPALQEQAGGPTLKVAMLQMNAVGVAFDKDPVPAHIERATMFVREAKKRGADIALFPEQWSVGFSRNFNKPDCENGDAFWICRAIRLANPCHYCRPGGRQLGHGVRQLRQVGAARRRRLHRKLAQPPPVPCCAC